MSLKTVTWRYVINDLNGKEIRRAFYKKELQKTSQSEFTIKKLMKKKVEKLLVKWNGYDNFF